MAENEGTTSIPGTGQTVLNPYAEAGGDGIDPNQSIMSSSGDQNQSTPGVEYGPNQSVDPGASNQSKGPYGDGYMGPPDLPLTPGFGNAILGAGAGGAVGAGLGEGVGHIAITEGGSEAVITAGEAIVDKIKQPKGKNIDNNN